MSVEQHGGLLHALPSRRDYFIAAALQGLLGEGLAEYQDVPRLAVDLADDVLRIAEVSPAPAGLSAPPPRAKPPGSGDVLGAASSHAESPVTGGTPATSPAGNPASPILVCEASFPGDADCPGPVTYDPKSMGLFCALHAGVEVVARREMHRLHGQRNRRPG